MNNRLEETPQIDNTDIILEVHKISKRFGESRPLIILIFLSEGEKYTLWWERMGRGRAPLLRFLQVPTHLAKVKSCLTERNIAD